MPEETQKTPSIQPFVDRMRGAGVSAPAVASFLLHYQRLCGGEEGFLPEKDIQPIGDLPDSETFDQYIEAGQSAVANAAAIKSP